MHQLQQQRDSSLNAARQAYQKQTGTKRYGATTNQSLNSISIDQENNNTQNLTGDNRVAYKYKGVQANDKKSATSQSFQGKIGHKEVPAFHNSLNNSKPPVMMQTTDSPPSCSLTCSPDRTIKKPTGKEQV